MTRLLTRSTLCLALTAAFALPTLAHAQAAAARPAASAQAEDARLAGFDAYVDAVRKQFEVPGIAVAIVEDGRIVYERGFGPREVGKPAQIDEHTMFAIASNTKAFTATALSMLADEGKLSLDDRVIDHLPWFRMSDAYVTREMRIKDLLAHRSGLTLGAGDLLYWPTTTYTTEEVARRLKDVPLGGSLPRPVRLRQHPVRRRAAGDRRSQRHEVRRLPAPAHLRAAGHERNALQQRSPDRERQRRHRLRAGRFQGPASPRRA